MVGVDGFEKGSRGALHDLAAAVGKSSQRLDF
jgi:hypothetical protein